MIEVCLDCPVKDFCQDVFDKVKGKDGTLKVLGTKELPELDEDYPIWLRENVFKCMSDNIESCVMRNIYQSLHLRELWLQEDYWETN